MLLAVLTEEKKGTVVTLEKENLPAHNSETEEVC
jgi:hypothetical protein